MLGGGMRQAGILAAAGIVAVEQMTERLGEDHARAKMLAVGLSRIQGITFTMGMPQTNMVFPSLSPFMKITTAHVEQALAKEGIKVDVVNDRLFRLVTHYWISDDDVQKTIHAFEGVIRE
jgi:threonine aldolase